MKEIVNIAKISGTHHLKGTLKMVPLIEDIDLLVGNKVMVEYSPETQKIFTVESVSWLNTDKALIKFEELNHIEEAKKLMNFKIYIRRELLGELTNDDYYVFDLIDVDVYTVENEYLGKITDILTNTAQDIYVINEGKDEIMIPVVDEFIKEIDIKNNKIVVKLIEGMRNEE